MDEAAARQAYEGAGHAPGEPAAAEWWGRVCHRHRVAYPTPSGMGAHFSHGHAKPEGYYTAEPEAA